MEYKVFVVDTTETSIERPTTITKNKSKTQREKKIWIKV
jgi:hypothetical protein